MTTVQRTFIVAAPPATVIDYLKDFANAETWDPGTERCSRVDSGPITVGSSWHNVSKIMGVRTELDYTLSELTNDRLVFVGTNDKATSTDSITVRPAGDGSEVTYHVDLAMHGIAKLGTPLMKLVFEKLASDTTKQLTKVLDNL